MNRFAVIDLGSNTFHLLIVEKTSSGFLELYRERAYTKLGKGGSDRILGDSFSKGIECLEQFRLKLDKYEISDYKAFGTAALRTASNGSEFVEEALNRTNINIHLIDGNQEAIFITNGVKAAVDLTADDYLIMDIGGGSVEFILLNKGEIHWKQSFPIGLAILKAKFHSQEPIPFEDLQQMHSCLHDQLSPLKEQLSQIPKIKSLVGASGTFEVIQAILNLPRWNNQTYKCHTLDFFKVREMIMRKTHKERVSVKGLPMERVDLIVVALYLINYILQLTQTEEIFISDYALKEGVIAEHFDID